MFADKVLSAPKLEPTPAPQTRPRKKWRRLLLLVLLAAVCGFGVAVWLTWPLAPDWLWYNWTKICPPSDNNNAAKNSGQKYDSDRDGLIDYQESNLYGTDPFNPDTDGDGFDDGTEIATRHDPLKANSGIYDTDGDALPDFTENKVTHTDPNKYDTDNDGYSDGVEVMNGYNPLTDNRGQINIITSNIITDARREFADAHLLVPKIKVDAPIIWLDTVDEKKTIEALPGGVIHYATSAFPGQRGNVVISGHAANYWWIAGNFNTVLANIGDLQLGDEITIQNSKYKFVYKITDKQTITPDNADWLKQADYHEITLLTCGVGGNLKQRRFVRGVQILPEVK